MAVRPVYEVRESAPFFNVINVEFEKYWRFQASQCRRAENH